MSLRTLLIGVRCLLLLLVAGWLAVSIAWRVLNDHPEDPRPYDVDGAGIRILLCNPAPDAIADAEPVDPTTWSQVNVTLRRRALLYCPANPTDLPACPLPEGARLRLFANDQAGITVSSDHQPTDQTWNVQEVRLIPFPGDLEAAIADDPAAIARDDIEAPGGEALFTLGDRDYRGSLTIRRASWKRLHVVNALPLVAWLDGVLQTEATAAWPPEALKALAIVCRSTAFVAKRHGGIILDGLTYHLEDTEPAYHGTGHGGERIRATLVATRGQILTYRGQPFTPPYHMSSGGYLAAVDTVFPGGVTAADGLRLSDVLPADVDPWCHAGAQALDPATSWEQETVFSGANIKRVTDRNHAQKGVGWIHTIETTGEILGPKAQLRRLRTVKLIWYGGEMELPVETFRELLALDPEHPIRIPSSLWTKDSPKSLPVVDTASKREQTWRIISYGKGHGVGMSLVSAYHLATQVPPMPVADILGTFYKHAQIDTIDHVVVPGTTHE